MVIPCLSSPIMQVDSFNLSAISMEMTSDSNPYLTLNAGPGARTGVWLPGQRLPEQRALPKRGGGYHLPHGFSWNRP